MINIAQNSSARERPPSARHQGREHAGWAVPSPRMGKRPSGPEEAGVIEHCLLEQRPLSRNRDYAKRPTLSTRPSRSLRPGPTGLARGRRQSARQAANRCRSTRGPGCFAAHDVRPWHGVVPRRNFRGEPRDRFADDRQPLGNCVAKSLVGQEFGLRPTGDRFRNPVQSFRDVVQTLLITPHRSAGLRPARRPG
jgi:hypothetical protein